MSVCFGEGKIVTRCKVNLSTLEITYLCRQEAGAGMTNLAGGTVVHAVSPPRYSLFVIPAVFKRESRVCVTGLQLR